MLKLTPKQQADLRLQCLSLVVNTGSRVDANKPADKAEEYYKFVVDALEQQKPVVVEIEEPEVETANEELPEAKAVSNPFGDSGRQQVIIS